MQTHQLGKLNYQTVELEFDSQPVYCIVMKEMTCELDVSCNIEQLTPTGGYHLIIVTPTGTFEDTIFKDEEWESVYADNEFEDDEDEFDEDEKPDDYEKLIQLIGAKIDAAQITM